MLIKVTDGTDYLKIISSLKAKCIQIKNASQRLEESHFFYIRHDVDSSLDKALKMARFEYEHNIRSTYFLLHTAQYFDYTKSFIAKCKEFASLGHDIGFHNNAVTVWWKEKKPIKEIVSKPIDFLRDCGLKIVGTSSHGDPLCYKKHYINYEMWKEVNEVKITRYKNPKVPQISLADVGLKYEAYFLKYKVYLSDSHGDWGGSIAGTKIKSISNAIELFNKMNKGALQILLHPIYWEVK